jgi:hypothetical protein
MIKKFLKKINKILDRGGFLYDDCHVNKIHVTQYEQLFIETSICSHHQAIKII